MAAWIPRSRTVGCCIRKKVGLVGLVGHESSNCFTTSSTTCPPFRCVSPTKKLGGSNDGNPHGFLSNSATLFRFWRLESSRAESQLLDAEYVEDNDDLNQVASQSFVTCSFF